jgi:hypothetical protein
MDGAQLPVLTYSIAAIAYAPAPMDKVGHLKAGFVCLPKGTLRWRDMARGQDTDVIAELTAVLQKSGLAVVTPPDPLFLDAPPLTRYRIKVVIETMHLNLCIAGSRLVKQRPSGDGTVHINWETYDRVSRALAAKQVFEVPLATNGRDARNSSAVLGDALVESAVRYAAARKAAD